MLVLDGEVLGGAGRTDLWVVVSVEVLWVGDAGVVEASLACQD